MKLFSDGIAINLNVMNKSGSKNLSFPLRGYVLTAVAVWTLTLAASLAWNLHIENLHLRTLATDKARTHIQKDMAFRSWFARHGGVYVPVSERTPPSPWLAALPERDITTSSGKKLTLMNPAYIMRQLNEESATGLVSGHITSLKVLRPQNGPDEWEKKALKAFEKGRKEVIETSRINGRPYLRMMLPFYVEKGCLKCHGQRGYRVGDTRGGISTSVSLVPYQEMAGQAERAFLLSQGLLWLLGMAGIGVAGRQGGKILAERRRWEGDLKNLNRRLRMLSECNQALVRSERKGALLGQVCRSIVETGGYRMAWVGYAQPGPKKQVVPVAQAGIGRDDLKKLQITWDDSERGRGPTGTAIRTGAPCVVQDIPTAAGYLPWRQAALGCGCRSSVAIPLFVGNKTLGTLNIYSAEAEALDGEEMKLLQELADDLSFGISSLRTKAQQRRDEERVRRLNTDLEERVSQRTTQLEAANKELGAFAYSVSHDLRAPLRAINGFSQAILEDYHEVVDRQGQDYLNRIRAAVERMAQLIDDILELSRISRGELKMESVNLSALARSVAEELRHNEPLRQATFIIKEGMTAAGDNRLLRVALENLFANAWKFTGKREQTRIEFGVDRNREPVSFFVRDNGAGFDPTYAEKLFMAFQRLHPEEEFPGTGIGLAIVQRIIHKHGGLVSAEGEVDRGATFYFSLPETSDETALANHHL